MKYLIFFVTLLVAFACKKLDNTSTAFEEKINFKTNLDSIQYNVSDTLPVIITISSKLPSAGVNCSITSTWTDSSKQIFKLDTTITQSSLSLLIPGHRKSGNYSLNINITSKSTPSNTSSSSIKFINDPQKRFSTKTVEVDIIYPEVSQKALTSSIRHFPAKIYMATNGEEYIIHNPSADLVGTTFEYVGPIQMKRQKGQWILDRIYKDMKIGNSRNTHIINENSYLVCDATELPGGIGVDGQDYLVTMSGGELSWKKINQDKRWSHDISGGDLNNDGLIDVVSASPLSIYTQNSNGTFTKRDDLYSWKNERISAFAVEVADVHGDATPEIITGGYFGGGNPLQRNNLAVYSYNRQTKQFEISFDNQVPNLFFNIDLGATSIEVHDFDKDGKKDIAVAREGGFNERITPIRAIEIWKGDGKGNFGYLDKIEYTQDQLDFTEFICKDVNNDGYLDILLNGNGGGDLFRVKNQQGAWIKTRLNHLIHLNDGKGKFNPFNGYNLDVDGNPNVPDYLYPFMRNNKLCFYGTNTTQNITNGIRVSYWDINVF